VPLGEEDAGNDEDEDEMDKKRKKSSGGWGGRSPYGERIHSEAHPCEVVAEGVVAAS
jgi:hypothetical protein